jgi:ankyrin repeat protein
VGQPATCVIILLTPSSKGQLDHLCQLPSDSARRKALDALPPTLSLTYERILARVNREDEAVQELVERALRWVVCARWKLSPAALAEVVSIESDDTLLSLDAMPTEGDIMHWCSSLIRKDLESGCLEPSHYSVVEFLKSIPNDPAMSPFSRYRVDSSQEEFRLALDCLQYLSMDDFATGYIYGHEDYSNRGKKHPFFDYASFNWDYHVSNGLIEKSLLDLMCGLFRPQKSQQFLAWSQNRVFGEWVSHSDNPEKPMNGILEEIAESLGDVLTLHIAAALALTDVVAWLLEKGSDWNRRSRLLSTPIICASMGVAALHSLLEDNYSKLEEADEDSWRLQQRMATLEALILVGADPNVQGRDGGTPLQQIMNFTPNCSDVNFGAVRILCEAGAICTTDIVATAFASGFAENDIASLFSKARLLPEDRLDIMELIASCVDHESMRRLFGDVKDEYDSKSSPTNEAYGRLIREAARWNQIDVLRQYFDKNRSIDLPEEQMRRTALHNAALYGHLDAVRFLIENHASPKVLDVDGNTPLHLACDSNSGDVVAYLWEHTESINLSGESPLMLVAAYCSADVLSLALTRSNEEKVFGRASNGYSLLHFAAAAGNARNVKCLLEKGLDINDLADDLCTPIMTAMKNPGKYSAPSDAFSYESVLQILIDCGAEVNLQDVNGNSLLHFEFLSAEEWTSGVGQKCVTLLGKESQILLNCKNKAGQTPIMLMALFAESKPDEGFKEVLELLELFLNKGASPNLQDKQGQTCLHIFCKYATGPEGELAVKMLLDHNASYALINVDLNTALDEALQGERDNAGIVDLLLTRHLDLHEKDDRGQTMLHRVFGIKRLPSFERVAKSVIARGADLTLKDRQGKSVLVSAMMVGQDSAILRTLISSVSDNDLVYHSYGGSGLLNLSIRCSLPEDIINTVLEMANDVNSRDKNSTGNTALHWASSLQPSPKVMRRILSLCDNFSIKNYADIDPLFLSAASGNDWMLSELIAAKVDLETKGTCQLPNGDFIRNLTPLLATVYDKQRPSNQKCAELLIEAGVDLEAQASSGWRIVHYCSHKGDESMLQLLSKYPVNFASMCRVLMEPGCELGSTALHIAARRGHTECVRVLLDTGSFPDINIEMENGVTPLLLAASGGSANICSIFCDKGANPDIVDLRSGNSPLHEAASIGSEAITLLLIEHGADISLRNKAGLTAELEAMARGHSGVARILRDATVDSRRESNCKLYLI